MPANANGDEAMVASLHTFAIDVVDGVKDGCLPQPNSIKDAVEATMRRNGYEIVEPGVARDFFVVSLLGYQNGPGCVVHVGTYLSTRAVMTPHWGRNNSVYATYRVPISANLLSGPLYGMQARLEEVAVQAANDLFVHISRAKNNVSAGAEEFRRSDALIEGLRRIGQ